MYFKSRRFYSTDCNSILHLETLSTKPTDHESHPVWKGYKELVRANSTLFRLIELLKEYNPDHICGEVPLGAQSASAAKALGIATAILSAVAALNVDVPFYPTKPNWVKHDTIGKEKAKEFKGSKRVMIDWAFEKYPDAPWRINKSTGQPMANQEHVADAIAIIYSGIIRNNPKLISNLR